MNETVFVNVIEVSSRGTADNDDATDMHWAVNSMHKLHLAVAVRSVLRNWQ